MGQITTKEKILIGAVALIYWPFRVVYVFLVRPIGQTLGLIEKDEQFEITPEQQAANEAIAAAEQAKIEKENADKLL